MKLKSVFFIDNFFVLNLLFFLYFISSLFPNSDSAKLIYFVNVLFIFVVTVFLMSNRKRIIIDKNIFFLFFCLGLSYFPLLSIFKLPHIYVVIFYIKCVSIYLFFKNSNLSSNDVVAVINKWFVFYACLSLLFWLNILPNPNASDFLFKEEFEVNFFGFSYYVLPGIEGSPANIDSYSGLVLLLNIFVTKDAQYRKLAVLLSITCIVASLRMTPIVALFLLFSLSVFLQKKTYFLIFYYFYIVSVFTIIYLLMVYPDLKVFNVNLTYLAYLATHARTMIWVQQIDVLLNNYDVIDYIIGNYDVELFKVPTYQLTGAETGNFQSNPHNTFLLLLFRSPFLFVLFSLWISYLFTSKVDRGYYIPILFVMLACFTNSSIFSLENPIYLVVIIFSGLCVANRMEGVGELF
ncbi:hypothetical protein [Shewanella algae]|uniref:hypothetical protein n=1 Tax=Shewanella algae TaxID=38313 RepID=UPI001C57E03D|nr:hypothetical protein [Shewanella algae]